MKFYNFFLIISYKLRDTIIKIISHKSSIDLANGSGQSGSGSTHAGSGQMGLG